MKTTAIAIALALAASTLHTLAQETTRPEGRPSREAGPQGGHGGEHKRPHPLFEALDANHDGVIDEQEIANAPAALKKLDKNSDGKLTHEEIMPPRPDHKGGPDSRGGNRQGGQRPGGSGENENQPTRQRPASE